MFYDVVWKFCDFDNNMEDVFFVFISEYFVGMFCCIRFCSEFGKLVFVYSKCVKLKNYFVIICWYFGVFFKYGVFYDCNFNWCRLFVSFLIVFEILSISDSVMCC